MSLQLKVAGTSDIPEIAALMTCIFGTHPKLETQLEKWISSQDYCMTIAQVQSQVVGVSTWTIRADINPENYSSFGARTLKFLSDHQRIAWAMNLAVHPHFRHQQIGRKLSAMQQKWVHTSYCDACAGTSWVHGTQDSSRHLYESAGFLRLGESRTYLREQMLAAGALCRICNTAECNCISIFYGANFSDLSLLSHGSSENI